MASPEFSRCEDPRIRRIWSQQVVPVVVRQRSPNPVLVRLPFASDNRTWLKEGHRNRPKWDSQAKHWATPISWFDDLIQRSLIRYGRIYVIQLYKQQQKCAAACWNAKGFHCECSCLGANHGSGHPGGIWHEVSEKFAFQWGSLQYACRLIVASDDRQHA